MRSLTPNQYTVYGPPHAAPLLLVHGSTVTQAMWWPQIDALAREFRVITVDLPGHGASAHIP
jgi:pimeloyl-ACP methyl ester carboxylesterase